MGTGVDLDVRCIVHARPTKSEMRWVQDIGRGLRTAEGKDNLIVLDHGATALKLGLPTDIFHDRLRTAKSDKAEKEAPPKETPTPRECPQCHFVIPPKTPVCPNCGHVAKRQSNVVCEDGELIEIGAAPKPIAAKPKTAIGRIQLQGKQATYSQLLALQGGKADGWVGWKYKALWGDFPRGLTKVPAEPSAELSAWVRSEQIRFAKSRASQRSAA
jgi:hypothetical protein